MNIWPNVILSWENRNPFFFHQISSLSYWYIWKFSRSFSWIRGMPIIPKVCLIIWLLILSFLLFELKIFLFFYFLLFFYFHRLFKLFPFFKFFPKIPFFFFLRSTFFNFFWIFLTFFLHYNNWGYHFKHIRYFYFCIGYKSFSFI